MPALIQKIIQQDSSKSLLAHGTCPFCAHPLQPNLIQFAKKNSNSLYSYIQMLKMFIERMRAHLPFPCDAIKVAQKHISAANKHIYIILGSQHLLFHISIVCVPSVVWPNPESLSSATPCPINGDARASAIHTNAAIGARVPNPKTQFCLFIKPPTNGNGREPNKKVSIYSIISKNYNSARNASYYGFVGDIGADCRLPMHLTCFVSIIKAKTFISCTYL